MSSKKARDAYERMFGAENHYAQIPLVYPVVIKHSSGNVDKFYENGMRETLCANLVGGFSFSRVKETKPRDEYEFYIRRLMYVSKGVGSEADWDEKIKEGDEIHDKMLQCSLEEYINGVKLVQDEQPRQVEQVENKSNTGGEVGGGDPAIKIYAGEEDPF